MNKVAVLTLSGFLALYSSSAAIAGPKEDARAAIDQWAAAFNAHDVEKVVAVYTPDALVLGTLSPALASKPDDLRKYFGASAAAKSVVKMGETWGVELSTDAVLFTGFYEFSRPRDGQTATTPARFSFVVLKREGAWKIVHHHSSARPKPAQ